MDPAETQDSGGNKAADIEEGDTENPIQNEESENEPIIGSPGQGNPAGGAKRLKRSVLPRQRLSNSYAVNASAKSPVSAPASISERTARRHDIPFFATIENDATTNIQILIKNLCLIKDDTIYSSFEPDALATLGKLLRHRKTRRRVYDVEKSSGTGWHVAHHEQGETHLVLAGTQLRKSLCCFAVLNKETLKNFQAGSRNQEGFAVWYKRRASFQTIDGNHPHLDRFPRLTITDLKRFALGTYQLKQARSYFGEHVRQSGIYSVEVNTEIDDDIPLILGLNNYLLRESDNTEANILRKRHRMELRAECNPYDLDDTEFVKRYRLTKQLTYNLCDDLRPLMKTPKKSTDLSVETKVLIALAFYATGSYQRPTGSSEGHFVAQQTVSKVIAQVTACLNTIQMRQKFIKFPRTTEERNRIKTEFYKKFKIPGVLGCIDCTQVAIIHPIIHEERYYCRKQYHSLNVQIVCDADMQILSVDASHGGATHDSFIWAKNVELTPRNSTSTPAESR
ncbi:hypothetical protein SFRURICE_005111 [Spodoptera frugiperda]|nr:hypothetical protein SFRURICE_005111 [Spodoptera frugiperda]